MKSLFNLSNFSKYEAYDGYLKEGYSLFLLSVVQSDLIPDINVKDLKNELFLLIHRKDWQKITLFSSSGIENIIIQRPRLQNQVKQLTVEVKKLQDENKQLQEQVKKLEEQVKNLQIKETKKMEEIEEMEEKEGNSSSTEEPLLQNQQNRLKKVFNLKNFFSKFSK